MACVIEQKSETRMTASVHAPDIADPPKDKWISSLYNFSSFLIVIQVSFCSLIDYTENSHAVFCPNK